MCLCLISLQLVGSDLCVLVTSHAMFLFDLSKAAAGLCSGKYTVASVLQLPLTVPLLFVGLLSWLDIAVIGI